MTEKEIQEIQRRAKELHEEMMGVRPAARTSDSDSENEGSSPSPPAMCVYIFNGCAHPQFCRDGCAGKPL